MQLCDKIRCMELSLYEASERLGVTKATVLRALSIGVLTGRRIANRWVVIDSESLKKYKPSRRGRKRTLSSGTAQSNYQLRLRMAVIEKLGGKCGSCGFNDWRVLQIDHKNGKGWQKKNKQVALGTAIRYRMVLADTSNSYQLLCANCNWVKRFEGREHATSTSARALIDKFQKDR